MRECEVIFARTLNMMKRIFQHYEGEIKDLSGSHFSTVKAVVNSLDNSVVVLWLYDKHKGVWYRLFIDGVYCGIDQFLNDKSLEDIDDDIIIINHSAWFQDKKLLEAEVFSGIGISSSMIVSLKFAKSECQLIYQSKYNKCKLKFIELNSS